MPGSPMRHTAACSCATLFRLQVFYQPHRGSPGQEAASVSAQQNDSRLQWKAAWIGLRQCKRIYSVKQSAPQEADCNSKRQLAARPNRRMRRQETDVYCLTCVARLRWATIGTETLGPVTHMLCGGEHHPNPTASGWAACEAIRRWQGRCGGSDATMANR